METQYIGHEIGKRICVLRQERKLTQEQLAQKAELDRSSLSRLECGIHINPNISTLIRIAKALNIPLAALFHFIEFPSRSWENGEIDYILYLEKIKVACYPPKLDNYAVSTLMEFLIYLPLIPIQNLFDSLKRIGGSLKGNESYVLDQINNCIKQIPQTPAKAFADMHAKELALYYPPNDRQNKPTTSEFWDNYTDYTEKLEELDVFFNHLRLISPPINYGLTASHLGKSGQNSNICSNIKNRASHNGRRS